MTDAFTGAVRVPAPEPDERRGTHVRNRDDEPDLRVRQVTHGLDDGRQPQAQPVDAHHQTEVQRREDQGAGILQTGHEAVLVPGPLGRVLGVHLVLQPCAFLEGQPHRVPGVIRHCLQRHKGHQHRGNTLDDVHPLPPGQAEDAVHLQQQARDRRADRVGDRLGKDEDPQHRDPLAGGEPHRQIQDDRREEPGLRGAQQEPDDVERGLARHCRHSRGEETPGQQDPGDPLAGTEPHHAGVAGDLEDGVPDEEDPSAQPVSGCAEADVLAHRQLREADIVPIEERDEIQKNDQRQHPPLDLADRAIT